LKSSPPYPALKNKVLILSPTRELAIQIDGAFRQLAHGMRIRTAVVVAA
jgi:superfamily II DNA/RNA helicase